MTGLYELHLSENIWVQVDVVLREIQNSSLTNLSTLCAADCSVSNHFSQPIPTTLDDGLFILKRLDVSGSFKKPEHLKHLIESTALDKLEYLNISRCTIDETSMPVLFGDNVHLSRLEVLGLSGMENISTGKAYHFFPYQKKYGFRASLKAVDMRFNKGLLAS